MKPIKELEIYIKQAGKYLMLGISRLVIPHLHFVWKTDVLSVDFNPKTNTKTSFSIIESLNMPSLPTIQIKTSKSLNLNEFDISLGTSNQLFSNFDIGFELFYNTVLSTLGISITFGNLDYTYSSLDFPDEFELLKNLQFSYIPDCRKTVLKSLEIRLVIKKLLNF